jgi:hypothetical protein
MTERRMPHGTAFAIIFAVAAVVYGAVWLWWLFG